MDWSGYGGYTVQPQEDIDDDEDFYGSGQASVNGNNMDHMQTNAGASASANLGSLIAAANMDPAQSNSTAPLTPGADEQKKLEQQKQLETLRKRLMAKRGNSARPETPSKAPVGSDNTKAQHNMEQQDNGMANSGLNEPSNDEFGIEALLAEGKAAAESKVARDNEAAALAASMHRPVQPRPQHAAAKKRIKVEAEADQVKPIASQAKHAESTQPDIASPPERTDIKPNNNSSNPRPVNLSDPYYDDLSVWLEYTGYHDVQFRNSKLGTYKARRDLEQKAAQIAKQLEDLKKAEKADLESLRATTAHPTAEAAMAPPPLPTNMPSGETRDNSNGLKRPHSPERHASERASRRMTDGGFKIRGANEPNGSAQRDNGSPQERRDSLPFAERRRSFDERHERDQSPERRQSWFNNNNNHRGQFPRGSNRGGHGQWNQNREGPRPFNAREREREDRQNFSGVNRVGGPDAHTGGSGLDLRKGGVRYFMIKSWNHDNVAQAMKDGLWATQEKNQSLLTEAFHTSRHVILLFSVNRSMAFQGYALMTSPPDPSLPTPTFCNKLNWATSPAFSLRWLATTPVHFRLVGHLKNTCNPDEEGLPRAVLVGKDGQEISQDAGMGVVWILDEAEEVEGRGRLREE